jgi:hypothetical protein
MSLVAARTLSGRIWVARPNHSLSVAGRRRLFVATATASGLIAFAFSCFGAWPVIPFAGLELALLWWALLRTESAADDFETITLESGHLTIEKRHGARVERHEFQPILGAVAVRQASGPERPSLADQFAWQASRGGQSVDGRAENGACQRTETKPGCSLAPTKYFKETN